MVILNDWPRLSLYRAEILRGLCLCWCRIAEEDERTGELEDIKGALRDAFRLLKAAIKDEVDLIPEIELLTRNDGRVKEIFGIKQVSTKT